MYGIPGIFRCCVDAAISANHHHDFEGITFDEGYPLKSDLNRCGFCCEVPHRDIVVANWAGCPSVSAFRHETVGKNSADAVIENDGRKCCSHGGLLAAIPAAGEDFGQSRLYVFFRFVDVYINSDLK